MFTRIRGKKSQGRCTKLFSDGSSALCCECGCQTPIASDTPAPEVFFGVIAKRNPHHDGEIELFRGEVCVGLVDPQKKYLCLDETEYIGIESGYMKAFMLEMGKSVPSWAEFMKSFAPLYTCAEIAQIEELVTAKNLQTQSPDNGYCSKCHTWCYGDCGA